MGIINVKIDLKDFKDYFADDLPKILSRSINFSVGKSSSFLASFIINNHLTGGTTSNKLKVRTGRLRQTTVALIPQRRGENTIEGGVTFGTEYASTHISAKRKRTTITPKRAKKLAIPITGSPVMTAAGVTKGTGSIRQSFPFLTRSGNVLADQRDGKFIPYFALKSSVTIESRVHLDEILDKKSKDIETVFNRAIKEFLGNQ